MKRIDRLLLLAFALANAILYSSLLPLWEGFDEPWHYGYVRYFASSRSLPVLGKARLPQEIWDSMLACPDSHVVHGAWPELQTFDVYFKLSAADRARERHALETIPQNNAISPHTNYEIQQAPLAYAIYAVPDWLLSRIPIPTRILWLRIFASALAAFVTLLSAEYLFRTLELPRAYQVLGVYWIFACQMYWATVAHIANDGLALALSIWFFGALAAFSRQPDRAGALRLGLAASLGVLTKAYFLPLTVFAAFWIAYRRARMLPIFAGIVAVLAGPWYLRNLLLYHSVSGLLMASAGITPRQAITSLARVDFSRAIPYMLRATLWTANNSFTTFSAATLNALLALLAAGLLLYVIDAVRRPPKPAEQALLGGIAVYGAAVLYVLGNDVIFLHGASAGASPWYTVVLLAPVLALALLGMSRMPRFGAPIAVVTVLLWSYVCIATYLVKLIPLYGGYDKGRNTLKETLHWYISNGHDLTSMLSTISLAPPAMIYLETGAVAVLVIAFAARLARAMMRPSGLH